MSSKRRSGVGPEEGLIYRVEELARQSISGTLFQGENILRFQANISLVDDWKHRVEGLLSHPSTHQKELIRTLLVVAMLAQDQEVGLFVEQPHGIQPGGRTGSRVAVGREGCRSRTCK